jgi:hypothetical protein
MREFFFLFSFFLKTLYKKSNKYYYYYYYYYLYKSYCTTLYVLSVPVYPSAFFLFFQKKKERERKTKWTLVITRIFGILDTSNEKFYSYSCFYLFILSTLLLSCFIGTNVAELFISSKSAVSKSRRRRTILT